MSWRNFGPPPPQDRLKTTLHFVEFCIYRTAVILVIVTFIVTIIWIFS